MRILTIKEYHALEMERYLKDLKAWRLDTKSKINEKPVLRKYGIRNKAGTPKKNGYVAISETGLNPSWGGTREEAERQWMINNIPF